MICHPSLTDISRIKEIWMECFGDDEETVDFYLKTCFSLEDCFVSKSNDKVEAVIQMIPCRIIDGNNEYIAKYMYAVCTDPLLQGRGIMSSLINEACEIEKRNGTDAVLCIPANKGLFDFYYKFGFVDGIYSSSVKSLRNELKNDLTECLYNCNTKITDFNLLRNTVLKDRLFVSFPDKYMKLCKGFEYSFCWSEDFYCIFNCDNDTVFIADCYWIDENAKKKMNYCLLNETSLNQFVFNFPSDNANTLKGVIKYLKDDFLNKRQLYLGIKME